MVVQDILRRRTRQETMFQAWFLEAQKSSRVIVSLIFAFSQLEYFVWSIYDSCPILCASVLLLHFGNFLLFRRSLKLPQGYFHAGFFSDWREVFSTKVIQRRLLQIFHYSSDGHFSILPQKCKDEETFKAIKSQKRFLQAIQNWHVLISYHPWSFEKIKV